MRYGDLVETGNKYGIILSVEKHEVFLGNGLHEVLDDEAWAAATPVMRGGVPINFAEILVMKFREAVIEWDYRGFHITLRCDDEGWYFDIESRPLSGLKIHQGNFVGREVAEEAAKQMIEVILANFEQ